MTIIEKIKEKIRYYEYENNETRLIMYNSKAIDYLKIIKHNEIKIETLQWVISELEKEADRKKCMNCEYNKNCPKVIFDNYSGNVYYLTSCSNFIDKDEK